MNKFLFVIAALVFTSCADTGSKGKNENNTAEQLVGEWNNLSIKIDINSKNNTDSNEVFAVDRPQWEEILKIKPIRAYFRADSSYNFAHYNLKDSLVYNPSGKWWIEGDKLITLQTFPSPDTTAYLLSIKKDTASFEAIIDWDMDGKKDDKYFGRQIKVTNAKN